MRMILSVLLSLLALTACSAPKPQVPLSASVIVDTGKIGQRVSASLFGSNLQWEHDGDGLVSGQSAKFPAALMASIQKTGITSIRFPGGALANTYRWKSGIGQPGQRPEGKGFAGQSLPSNFGTDELIRLARATGAQPVVTVNLSAGPEEAADWVEYLNGNSTSKWGSERTVNVGPEPARATYWELGNELYSPSEPGHLDAAAYADQVKTYIAAMKKRDPRIKIGVAIEASFLQAAWMRNVFPHLLTWNEEVLRRVGREVDFLSLHFYAPFDKQFGNEALNRLVWAGPAVFESNLAMIREVARKYCRPNVELAVTEYSTFFGEKIKLDERISGTENALFNSMMMMAFMRHPEVTLANHWSLLNNSQFGMLVWDTNRLSGRPWLEAYQQLRKYAGAQLVSIEVQSPSYTVEAKGNIPRIERQPALDALSVIDGNIWRMTVLNRSPDSEIDVTVTAKGIKFPAKLQVTMLVPESKQRQWQKLARQTLIYDSLSRGYKLRLPPGAIAFLES